MDPPKEKIPDLTLETLARSFYRDATEYGFSHVDYVRFVNRLLDVAMKNGNAVTTRQHAGPTGTASHTEQSSEADGPTDLPLHGKRIVVRRFEPEGDLPLLERWLADSRGRYFLLSRITSQRLDIRQIVCTDSSVLGMVTLPDSTPIGCVGFLDVDRVQHKAELRKLIGEPAQRGRGLAREASAIWIRYGLTALELRKIYLNTLETDLRNVRLNEALGFKTEGILRNEVLIDGAYHDVLRMGLLRQ